MAITSFLTSSFILLKVRGIFIFLKLYLPIKLMWGQAIGLIFLELQFVCFDLVFVFPNKSERKFTIIINNYIAN